MNRTGYAMLFNIAVTRTANELEFARIVEKKNL